LVTNTYIYSESCQRLFDLHDLDLHWHSIATFLGPLESTEIAGCSSRRMTPRMDCIEPTWLEPPHEYERSASAKFGEISYKKKTGSVS
jgi:hypothetical protein